MTAPNPTGTVISVAPSGTHAKSDVPHLPVTPDEVANAAADCERIGAAVVDLEPRRDTVLADVVAAIRARTNLTIRITAHARSETLQDLLDTGADILACPLDAPADFLDELGSRARAQGTAVHYEARALEQLAALPARRSAHVVLVFDTHGMPGDVQTFTAALAQLPAGVQFCATGLEAASVPVMLTSLAAGGHLRIGMSDTLEYAKDVEVRDNAQLAARAAGVAKIAQRPPISAADATEILAPGA